MVLSKFLDDGMLVHTVREYVEEEKAIYLANGYHEVSDEDLELYETLRYGYDFETGKPKELPVYEPSIEELQAEIQKQLTDAVQHVLDAKAQELLYDNCLSVCSYIDTGVAKFDAEGRAFRAWRSQVWAKGYEILAQVQAGERAIPSEEELLAELPELVIDYEA